MDPDVIVIGAGAAGLAAARRLAERSLRVVVIEARDRVGGRAWSRSLSRVTVPAELGAEFIHGRAEETLALLKEAGTAAIDTGGDSWALANGSLEIRDDNDFVRAASIFKQAASLNDDETVARFLERFNGDPAMRKAAEAARSFAEGFDAADPAIASARSIGEEWQSGVDSMIARPLGGYRTMFESLRNACATAGVQIHLSTRARRITWRRGEVWIEAQGCEPEPRTMQAQAAIVTLPAGVLRHAGDEDEIVFAPELPAAKREALKYVETGRAVRVVLAFRTAFWETIHSGRYRDAGFFRAAGAAFTAYWTQLPIRSELIVAWTAGPNETMLAALSEADVVERALAGFGTLLGEPTLARDHFVSAAMHDWSGDPLARGAYSYVIAGGGNARASLAAPLDDALFFAGEATSSDGQGGTVNGALQTGERAAREAATALGAAAC